MAIDEKIWGMVQDHLGYSADEMKLFRDNPRNTEVLSKAAGLMNKTIVAEVIESHGCNSGHKVGEKFYFDGAGNLITKLCPKRICCFALSPLNTLLFCVSELVYAGIDPNEMRFKSTGCFDVGIKCGGWGHIVMEISVHDRDNAALSGER